MKRAQSLPLKLSLALGAGALLAGCMMDPPGPSPVCSRLPATQTGTPQLSQQEKEQYNQIDRQVMAEQQASMAADAAARAYYYYPAPVSVYGGYYGGGWGRGWGSGVGVSYGTGYWW
jgi:hypothetical protein